MAKKRLMILGAGKNEIPAVLKAKDRGVETIVVDMNPNAPAIEFADKAIIARSKDSKEYIDIAMREHIDGVMTVSVESLVRKVSAIANAMGLPGISEATAMIATDKSLMRNIFLEKGIASPKFIVAENMEEALEKVSLLNMPLVIKPVDQAGSRGVFQIKDREDLRKFFKMSKNISKRGMVVIEEFIDGIESTIDAITVNGVTHILGISDKVKVHSPNIIAMDLAFPPAYSKEKIGQVENLVKKMLKAAGLNHGASHTEVIITEDGPQVVEFAARSGGGLIPSDILPHLCGFDAIDKLISLAIGENPGIDEVELKNGADLRFFRAPSGRLKRISGLEEALKMKGVHRIDFIVREGDFIKPLTEDNDRAGFVITYGRDRAEAVSIADRVEALIKFELY